MAARDRASAARREPSPPTGALRGVVRLLRPTRGFSWLRPRLQRWAGVGRGSLPRGHALASEKHTVAPTSLFLGRLSRRDPSDWVTVTAGVCLCNSGGHRPEPGLPAGGFQAEASSLGLQVATCPRGRGLTWP